MTNSFLNSCISISKHLWNLNQIFDRTPLNNAAYKGYTEIVDSTSNKLKEKGESKKKKSKQKQRCTKEFEVMRLICHPCICKAFFINPSDPIDYLNE